MATHDPALLDALEDLPAAAYRGPAWRHMFNDYRPERANTLGARWNPPGVAAIYTSLERAVAIAEGDHAVAVQPRRFYTQRVVYGLDLEVPDVVDLTGAGLTEVGLDTSDVAADDHTACQRIGGAAAWLGRGGLLVPSARAGGTNLVVFIDAIEPDADFRVTGREVIEQHPPRR